jgi:hypothetical protein
MAEGNLSLQAQWEGARGGDETAAGYLKKNILLAPLINYVSSCLHIKAELGCEVPQLGFWEYIF